MTLTVNELLALVGVCASLIGGAWALITLAGKQFSKRLDERFAMQEKARHEGRSLAEERMVRMETRQTELERDVRNILVELPREYVARTDYVRRETIIEGKIDQLALRWENWTLKAGQP